MLVFLPSRDPNQLPAKAKPPVRMGTATSSHCSTVMLSRYKETFRTVIRNTLNFHEDSRRWRKPEDGLVQTGEGV
jgi:hypothetical protein